MKRTPLHAVHQQLGARLVDFAGFEMPIQYPGGINEEHMAVRSNAGLFDVSHMGEIRVTGTEALDFLSYATLNDPAKLKIGRGQYSMLPNARGGLVDDIFLYREGEEEYLVVANASNIGPVVDHLRYLADGGEVTITDESEEWGLLALQGPNAPLLLGRLVEEDLTTLKRNSVVSSTLSGCPVRLSRTGYTGEDGFEIFCRPDDAEAVWGELIRAGAQPCGLGARDTLRLEAGFPLYGHELTEDSNPLCTPFAWVVKDKLFYGREHMWDAQCGRRLVGLRMLERGIPRQGYRVMAGPEGGPDGEAVGEVTSGTLSPLTRDCIGFAWVASELSETGSSLWVEVRDKMVAAQVVELPFYKS